MDLTFQIGRKKSLFKVNYMESESKQALFNHLYKTISTIPLGKEIIICCIGTDRSTGDALGPLVGTRLNEKGFDHSRLYGTLDHPVHAVNLQDTIDHIANRYTDPFIIAIDACLGQYTSVGSIQVGFGPLKPGAGVHKELPSIGNMHITGVVNVSGFMEYFVLQNTRLSQVMNMAYMISDTLYSVMLLKDQKQSIRKEHSKSNPLPSPL